MESSLRLFDSVNISSSHYQGQVEAMGTLSELEEQKVDFTQYVKTAAEAEDEKEEQKEKEEEEKVKKSSDDKVNLVWIAIISVHT